MFLLCICYYCASSLPPSAWCEGITHCSKENTAGTSSNICLRFSDLPLSALGLSFFLHVSLSFPLFAPLVAIIQCSISYPFKIALEIHFPSNCAILSIQLNPQIVFFLLKQVEKCSGKLCSEVFTSHLPMRYHKSFEISFLSYGHGPRGGTVVLNEDEVQGLLLRAIR